MYQIIYQTWMYIADNLELHGSAANWFFQCIFTKTSGHAKVGTGIWQVWTGRSVFSLQGSIDEVIIYDKALSQARW